CYQYNSGWTF
nr:immunoglobulin light chain junction region [Macaca mulatta]MOX27518.1 immunoglobulin light chain junction region [Macaca mulatta]